MKISFDCLSVEPGRVSVQVNVNSDAERVFLSVPDDFRLHCDCAAACFSTFCGSVFNQISFDFPVSDAMKLAIASRTKADVLSTSTCEPRAPGAGRILNFSGGFDSLAAWLLVPDQTSRLAIEFGHWFTRESDFFRTLAPEYICQTDFRKKGFARNDWLFMGAPSMLYAHHASIGSISFGTIFEAETSNLFSSPPAPSNQLFTALNIKDETFTQGLTEFGTAMIIHEFASELVEDSIRSLAAEWSEKSLRKRLLVHGVRNRGGKLTVPKNLRPTKDRYKFGQTYAVDFLSIIFARMFGPDVLNLWMDDTTGLDLSAVSQLNVDWVFKWNSDFDHHIPSELFSFIKDRLARCGIEDFSASDHENLARFRTLLLHWR